MFLRHHRDLPAFVRSLHLHYSVRLHAAVLLASAALGGLLVSWLLLQLGLQAPFVRFPLAVLFAYLFFLGFVHAWLSYIGLHRSSNDPVDVGDVGSGFDLGSDVPAPRGGGALRFEGHGGTFDGGGASTSFDGAGSALAFDGGGIGAGKGGGGDTPLGDLGDADVGDAVPIALLLIVLVAFAATLGWVVTATPLLLVETAVEAALAAGFVRSLSRSRGADWFTSLFRKTVWKACALVAMALLLGLAVRWMDPAANTLGQAVARMVGA